ncbi:MAG: hypothetical protein JXX14_00970, partial [Deltaproteobacteria bacterium]|nr:hypothetical protein [Deltaproteobacteria bacterium]
MIKSYSLFAIILFTIAFLMLPSCDNAGSGKAGTDQETDNRLDTAPVTGVSDSAADSAGRVDTAPPIDTGADTASAIPDSTSEETADTVSAVDSASDNDTTSVSGDTSDTSDTSTDTHRDTESPSTDADSTQGFDSGPDTEDSGIPRDTDTATDTGAPADSDDTASGASLTDTMTETKDTEDSPWDQCGGPTSTPYSSADILLVVDNSLSMQQEQNILATALFTLINALSNPLDETKKPIDD